MDNKKNRDFLIAKKATPAEIKLYRIAVGIWRTQNPVTVAEIVKLTGKSRFTIYLQLNSMVNKGVLEKLSGFYYKPCFE